MCPLYVSGLIGPGDRKSIQPMAAFEEHEERTTMPYKTDVVVGHTIGIQNNDPASHRSCRINVLSVSTNRLLSSHASC
jgi:hypothetical protein